MAERIRDAGFTAAEVERLADEMLAALEHIHAAGVIHRDLKPANVLIDNHDRFRLTDFGIAQPSDATALTQTGNVVGTMKYMAPEVRAGHRATVRSDLYSLGVLLDDCGGEAVPSLAPLIAALAHDDPADRPGSAREAAALVGDDRGSDPASAADGARPRAAAVRARSRRCAPGHCCGRAGARSRRRRRGRDGRRRREPACHDHLGRAGRTGPR